MASPQRQKIAATALAVAALALAVSVYIFSLFGDESNSLLSAQTTPANAQAVPSAASGPAVVDQSRHSVPDARLAAVKVEPVAERQFPVEKEAVGSIDFNEDMETQVFTPYQGKIIALFAGVGDDVKKGQTLFTIDSPDLLAAE